MLQTDVSLTSHFVTTAEIQCSFATWSQCSLLIVECSPRDWEPVDSLPGWLRPQTVKMSPIGSLLGSQCPGWTWGLRSLSESRKRHRCCPLLPQCIPQMPWEQILPLLCDNHWVHPTDARWCSDAYWEHMLWLPHQSLETGSKMYIEVISSDEKKID